MKKYWERYSYDIVKVMLFHLVVGGFGVTLNAFEHMVFQGKEPAFAKVLFFIFIIGTFMFLLYGEMWKLGAKESPMNIPTKKYAGLYIGIFGSLLDFVIAAFMIVASFVKNIPDALKTVFATVDLVYNGMFLNLFKCVVGTEIVGEETKNLLLASEFPVVYLVTFIPAFTVCVLGYYLGNKEKHLTKLFVHETPEEKEIKAESKRLRDKDNND